MSTPELAGRGRATRCDGLAGCVPRLSHAIGTSRRHCESGHLPVPDAGRIAGGIAGRLTQFRNRQPSIEVRFWVGIGFWRDSPTQMAVP